MNGIIKRIIVAMAVFLTAIAPVYGEKVRESGDTLFAKDVFVNLPLKTLDILSKSTRLDMLDYYAADSIYKAPNGMEGLSELEKVTPDYLSVKITPVTSMQILMLRDKRKKEPACLVLYTIGGEGQAYDTDATFLGDRMEELPRDKYLEYPDILDFFNIPDKSVKEKIEGLVPFPTIEFTANPETGVLTAKLTVGEYMGKENFEYVRKYMKPNLQYKWNGKKYEMIKEK
ncbi:MAG: DUF3256 family protein [Muribaculaceae bacterium]|nr:DUF3256 family protein [Muribaculaceae bacterium]